MSLESKCLGCQLIFPPVGFFYNKEVAVVAEQWGPLVCQSCGMIQWNDHGKIGRMTPEYWAIVRANGFEDEMKAKHEEIVSKLTG